MGKKDKRKKTEWTRFEQGAFLPHPEMDKLIAAKDMQYMSEVWLNSRYQVAIERPRPVPGWPPMIYLSIKRLDRRAIHDWRDLQRIKNELCGTEAEGLEIYPAESRLIDCANQYHLWVFPPGIPVPFGFGGHREVSNTSVGGSKQRAFAKHHTADDLPEDGLLTWEPWQVELLKSFLEETDDV